MIHIPQLSAQCRRSIYLLMNFIRFAEGSRPIAMSSHKRPLRRIITMLQCMLRQAPVHRIRTAVTP